MMVKKSTIKLPKHLSGELWVGRENWRWSPFPPYADCVPAYYAILVWLANENERINTQFKKMDIIYNPVRHEVEIWREQ